MNYYYINGQGQQVGPVDKDALRYAGITPDTMVWFEGAPDWLRASNVPELADVLHNGFRQPQYGPQQYGQQPRYYGPQQYGPPQYGPQNGNYRGNMPQKPENYMWLAIATTILCCLPLGIVSIIFASKSTSCWERGDYNGAKQNANLAKTWGIASAITVAVGLILYFLFYSAFLGSILSEY